MIKKIGVGLLLTLVGCVHTPLAAVDDISNLKGGETGLILPVSLNADGCRLGILESKTAKEFPIVIPRGVQTIFIEIPPGTYTFSKLFCERNKSWDFSTRNWAPMLISSGQISAATPMDLQISEAGKLTTRFLNRNDIQKTYWELFARLRPAAQTGIFSAYNKKPITAKMTKLTEYQITVKLPATHLTEGEPDEANYPEFKECYAREFGTNPLNIGHISLTARYLKKDLSKINLIENDSVYSNQFYECIESDLKKFRPNRSDELVYDINL